MERQELEGGKTPLKNPRERGGGILRQKGSRVTRGRGLDLFYLQPPAHRGEEGKRSRRLSLERMRELGVPGDSSFYKKTGSIDEVIAEVERIGGLRRALSFDIDGAVVKVDDFAQRERLGSTSSSPNGRRRSNIRRRKRRPCYSAWRSTSAGPGCSPRPACSSRWNWRERPSVGPPCTTRNLSGKNSSRSGIGWCCAKRGHHPRGGAGGRPRRGGRL